jgi:putative nucleotidyltransferase with HDIG domain
VEDIYSQVDNIISPVYMVGGSVRDRIMGTEPKDYDFSTPLDPDTIERKIREAHKRPYLTGKRFGTVGVKISGRVVEITTFRRESYRHGCRKPEVEFVNDLTADLSRRDFTINAIALHRSRLIDPFHGRKDIENKLIRCVGNAAERFREDPLRMLRAARFASQFGFAIEADVLHSMKKLSHLILDVSRERWMIELDRLLTSPHVTPGLTHLMTTDLIAFMIPELTLQKQFDQRSRHHDFKLWDHTVRVVDGTPPEIDLRWAALLHDIAKPFVETDKGDRSIYVHHETLGYEMVNRLGMYLRWSKSRTQSVSELVRGHMNEKSPLRRADNDAKKTWSFIK